MGGVAIHERLRQMRAATGEDLDAFAERTGIRLHHLRAIEDGRFVDLPPGIYARAAIRSFATACGLEPAGILAECEGLLAPLADPIRVMARKHGARARPAGAGTVESVAAATDRLHSAGRALAGAVVDAGIVGALLMVVAGCAALLTRVSVSALSPAAAALGLVGVVLGAAYFLWFGGLGGLTPGRAAVHAAPPSDGSAPLTLGAIGVRAVCAATLDARVIRGAGWRLGRRLTRGAPAGSAPRSGPAPSPLRLPDPWPAPWLPASRPGAAPPPPLRQPRG